MALIQGYDAVLQFFKNDWIPFVCATDISINLKSDILPIRTVNDGHWKKNTYENLSYSIALSGLLKFDDANWTGWDMLDNMINFAHVLFRCSFSDEEGSLRTIQGYCMVDSSTLGISVGELVKDDFNLTGNGVLMLFDGLIPCPTDLTAITLTGMTASDGILHVSYTYSGILGQVKYRIDGTGPYTYQGAGLDFAIPGLPVGAHSIEIIPVCLNGYEGNGLTQNFTITRSLTCDTTISVITVTGTGPVSVTNTFSGSATTMKYRVDGGVWINAPISTPIVLSLPIGPHTIEEIPICSNGVEGTGTIKNFTIASSGTFTTMNYSLNAHAPGGQLLVYKNGVLVDTLNNSGAGSLSIMTSDSINVVLSTLDTAAHSETLLVVNTTTSTTLYNTTRPTVPNVTSYLGYAFTPAAGDTYTITASQS